MKLSALLPIIGIWKVLGIILLPLFIFGGSLWLNKETDNSMQWVAHTYQVEAELNQLLSLLQDMETGQRGFIITGKDSYLEPLEVASTQITQDTKDLRKLVSDNPNQQVRLDQLEPLITLKVDELNETIRLHRADRKDEALDIINSDIGKQYMDKIRVIIKDMHDEEKVLLKERQEQSNDIRQAAVILGLLSIILLLLLFFAIISALNNFITLRRQAESALTNAKLKADEANTAKSKFLATVSHEIRTPLNGILGTAQLLSMTKMNNEQTDLTKNLIQSGQLLTDLLTDVLDMSKIEEGKLTIEHEKFNLHSQLTSAFDAYTIVAEQKGLEYCFKTDISKSQLVESDPVRIRQVTMNLISNAVKFTPKGAVQLTAELAKNGEADLLKIKVKDTGPGISKENQEKVFEEFQQVDQNRNMQVSGTGLGLSIVKNIISAMKGTVSIHSTVGEGACFNVSIPITLKGEELSEEIKLSEALPDLSHLKILIAEDLDINVLVLDKALSKTGLQPVFASNGEEAVNAVLSHDAFDLIMMDFNMPKMDGISAIRAIRSLDNKKKAITPIWGLTAETMTTSLQEGYDAGMNDVVSKPINFNTLYAKLDKTFKKAAE